ncbi:MAG TPA: DUF1552 domain-containing protein [Polyangia bacterium]
MSLKFSDRYQRRAFLRGVGGAMIALPALEAFSMRQAKAQPPKKKVYVCFIEQMNGHILDMYNPTNVGPITTVSLKAEPGKAVSELADHAADIGIVKNIDHAFDIANGCGHPQGGNIAITASKPRSGSPGTTPRAPSADFRIAQAHGKEPLNLYAGRKGGNDENFAYGPEGRVRPANNKPFDVYMSLMGLTGMQTSDPGLLQRLTARDKSINDVLRTQIQDLFKRTDLSMEDRRRLDVHLGSIREIEVGMNRPMMGAVTDPGGKSLADLIMTVKTTPEANDLREDVAKTHLSLIALAFASDRQIAATVQCGGYQDETTFLIDGKRASMGYHSITHAVGGPPGAGRNDAMGLLHHKVDRIHLRYLKHMIEQLKLYKTAEGRPLLEDSLAVLTNQLGCGTPHRGFSTPWVYGGSGGGYLKTGIFVDAKQAKNNKILNSFITAAGVRKPNGDPIDDFGDAELAKGLLTEIVK